MVNGSNTRGKKRSRKGGSGRKVTGAVRLLFIARGLQLECVRRPYENLLVSALINIWEGYSDREGKRKI